MGVQQAGGCEGGARGKCVCFGVLTGITVQQYFHVKPYCGVPVQVLLYLGMVYRNPTTVCFNVARKQQQYHLYLDI